MSPEAHMSYAAVIRLRVEVIADRKSAQETIQRVREQVARNLVPNDDPMLLGFLALQIHGFYGAIESALERIVALIDERTAKGRDWHSQLLKTASLELPKLRPQIISNEAMRELDALRKFRHFVRHGYGVTLDGEKVREHLERMMGIEAKLEDELGAFDTFLESIVEELSQS